MKKYYPVSKFGTFGSIINIYGDLNLMRSSDIKKEDIKKAIENKSLESRSFQDEEIKKEYYEACEKSLDEGYEYQRDFHIKRIAFLAINGWLDPITVEKGKVTAGNHRLLAAIFRGDEYIDCEEIFGGVQEPKKDGVNKSPIAVD
jgi:hypothetical protein